MLWQDLRYAARLLYKRIGFSVLAILTLGLGIGANTAIFSALNGILLQSLPLPDPDALVLFDDQPGEGTGKGDPPTEVWENFSSISYRHFAEHVEAFAGLAASRSGESRLSILDQGAASSVLASGQMVSGNYFNVLGAGALLGRPLEPVDEVPSAPAAAVISHAYWQGRYAGQAAVIGRPLEICGIPFTIVGVMPPQFFGVRVRRAPDYWLPLRFQPQIERTDAYRDDRDVYWLSLIGRLKPGRDLRAAQAQVDVALGQFLREQGGSTPSREWRAALEQGSVHLVPGARGISNLRRLYAEPLRILLLVTAFVLLIACANITNLLLSRATERRAEIALRLALGASRWRLTRQLLTESLLLSLLGGALGLLIALWAVAGLKALVSRSTPVEVGLSLPVLAFTAGASLLAGLLSGFAPALRSSRGDLTTAMRTRTAGRDSGRLRVGLGPALVVGQVALSLVLLVASGLLVRSLHALAQTELGFDRDGVLVLDIDTRLRGFQPSELSDYYRRLLERVRATPGVDSATVARFSPMSGSTTTSNITVQGVAPLDPEAMMVWVNAVGPAYTRVLRLPLARGREFDERDRPGAPQVALVNRAFVEAYLPGQDPLGRRFGFGDDASHAGEIEIVGVVGDVKFRAPRDRPMRMVFLPLLQSADDDAYAAELEIRTTGDPLTAVSALRQAVAAVDPRVPIAGVTTLALQVEGSMRHDRLFARLVGVFGLLALVLASIGLYGLVSQAVARRTAEVGIRMALGADRRSIVRMLLKDAGALVLAGTAVGLPAAVLAMALIRNQLFGISARDPLTLGASTLLLAAVALVAGYLPARRAARLDPLAALREE
ncbi:MAG TPA: ABC transporter permease [Candidatus Polarisedimenticolaceae bacterium]|nr:ABC transporter permease [Candidatus Polarisedimenticolaceae bacterium]